MLKGTGYSRMTLLSTFLILTGTFRVSAGNLDTNALMAWLSPTNYYSHVRLEVSRNRFLSENRPEFTKEPGEMVQIEGALLPKSFYIKLGTNAYTPGVELINGEADSFYWQIGSGLVIENKDSAAGGGPTNFMARTIYRNKGELRGWLALGLIDIGMNPVEIRGTNFSASNNGVTLKGHFRSIDENGFPSSFVYELSDLGDDYSAEGTVFFVDKDFRKFETFVTLRQRGRFMKRIRIRIFEYTPATAADATRVFKPTDFLKEEGTVAKFILFSNEIRYAVMPSGQLVPFKVDMPRRKGFLSHVGWIAVITGLVATSGLAWLCLRLKNRKEKYN